MWFGCLNVEFYDEVICLDFPFFRLTHWCVVFLSPVLFFVLDWHMESYAGSRAYIFSVFKVVNLKWRFFVSLLLFLFSLV